MRIINISPIDALTADDTAFRKELIQTCINLFKAFPAEFETAIRSGDAAKVRFEVHRIKANVLMVEAKSVHTLLQNAQSQIGKGPLKDADVEELVGLVSHRFSQMVEELEEAQEG